MIYPSDRYYLETNCSGYALLSSLAQDSSTPSFITTTLLVGNIGE